MKNVIKKEERIISKNSEKCFAYNYPFNDKDLNLTFVEVKGRFPDEGLLMNESVKEIVLVMEGKGKINIENKEYSLKEGDAILIQPKQKYFWQGNFKLAVSCNPNWNPEQRKNIN